MKLITTTIVALWLVAVATPALADGQSPAPVAAVPHALVVHVAPLSSTAGEPVELEAMIDAPFAETLTARWRAIGEGSWHDVAFERSSAGGWFASLPPAAAPGLEYYIRGVDANGAEVAHFASATAPHMVRVDPALFDRLLGEAVLELERGDRQAVDEEAEVESQLGRVDPALFDRLEELDRARLLDHRDEVAIDAMGHNFGNRYGLPDRFLRAEVTYTHRMWRQLHHIAFGFGTISGKTPVSSTAAEHMSGYLNNGERYGFGELRLRVHPSFFIDARVALGVSQNGFDGAVRGQMIFGKPWRSALFIGGETIGDLGPTAWVRLQWDTAPPFLMGAAIVRTNLPGVAISSAGLYIAYDVSYLIATRYTLKAQVTYGARDGASHAGGGLGMAAAF